jgi:hypothetical protein
VIVVSMKPGTTVICFASIVCVFGPARPLTAALVPTATNRLSLDRQRPRARRGRIHRVHAAVQDDEVGGPGLRRLPPTQARATTPSAPDGGEREEIPAMHARHSPLFLQCLSPVYHRRMPQFTKHLPGTFSWPELATTDQKAAVAFYRALFGWDVNETPMGPNETYSVFN